MDLIRPAITQLEDSPIVEVWRMGRNRPDVIGLWAGESDLPTPAFICDAAARALAAGHTFYTDNRGIPALRQALADYYRYARDNDLYLTYVIINPQADRSKSAAQQNDAFLTAGVVDRDEHGITVRGVPLASNQGGWLLDLEATLAACDARTRLIYYASPGNPTGWIMERAEMERLLEFARARNVAIVADEVYQRLVYDRTVAPSLLEVARPDDPAYVVNSFSKNWAMTGWRLGWIVYPAGQAPIFEKMVQFNTSGGQAFLQEGAVVALRDGEEFVRGFVARCRAGWQQIGDGLRRMPRVRLVPNSASFYVMFSIDGVSDTLQFCKRAVEQAGVGLAPGMAFGGGADRHIRLCYARSPEQLDMALARLAPFIADYAEA